LRSLIASVFFALAAWFLWDPLSGAPPVEPGPLVDAAEISTAPRRQPLDDPPTIRIGGVEQRCSDCHGIFPSLPETADGLLQHGDLVHAHGMNDRCFNCHSLEERDKLVLHDGTLIGYREVEQLCAKCHGTVFRDWERGIHGRTNGSWDAASGRQVRLTCTECHDPHAPAFGKIAPLPGPHTFRMGEIPPPDAAHASEPQSPLRRHLRPERPAHPEPSEPTETED
jgi:hypothetical protein